MPSQTFRLVMRSGPTPGKAYELDQGELSIGRDISNHIVINDPEVSRRHARLRLEAGGYVIEDLGSTNGTFVDGQRLIGPHSLRHGETLKLGDNVELAFEAIAFDADATLVSSTGAEKPLPETLRVPQEQQALPPMEPPPPPAYEPPSPAPPPPAAVEPAYEPGYDDQAYAPEEEEERSRTWLYVGLGCLVVFLCICVGGAFVFDSLNLYCEAPFESLTEALGFVCP